MGSGHGFSLSVFLLPGTVPYAQTSHSECGQAGCEEDLGPLRLLGA